MRSVVFRVRVDPYASEVSNSVGNAIVHNRRFGWEGVVGGCRTTVVSSALYVAWAGRVCIALRTSYLHYARGA
jgi:hypothetical protein